MIKQFPNELAPKNERVQLALIAGDFPAACKYFEETKGKSDLEVWRSLEKLQEFVDWYRTQR